MKKCIVDGCNNDAVARGYCTKHYRQWKRNGEVRDIPLP